MSLIVGHCKLDVVRMFSTLYYSFFLFITSFLKQFLVFLRDDLYTCTQGHASRACLTIKHTCTCCLCYAYGVLLSNLNAYSRKVAEKHILFSYDNFQFYCSREMKKVYIC